MGSESKLQYIFRIAKVIFKYTNLVLFVVTAALWPLLAWLNFGMTQLDTDYYALRYVYYFLYMISQNIPYSAIDNMQMLIGDGFFLAQITCMLLYNTCSLRAMVFAMVPMLIFQNGKMSFDILTFVKEPFQKSTFVRLIGQHDSTYLIVMFTLLVSVMSIMDAIAVNAVHLTNLVYIPLVMYQVVKIMDTKQARLANSFFPILSLFFTIAAIYIFLAANVVANKDTVVPPYEYPLFKQKLELEAATGSTAPEEPAEPPTWL